MITNKNYFFLLISNVLIVNVLFLFYFILFYFILFYFILFYFILMCVFFSGKGMRSDFLRSSIIFVCTLLFLFERSIFFTYL